MAKKTKESKSELSIMMDIDEDLHEAPMVNKKPKEVKKEKPPERVPVIPEIKKVEAVIHYRVFEKISGRKWDQMAGFKSYVKRNKLGPMTVKKWHEALQAFLNKPV